MVFIKKIGRTLPCFSQKVGAMPLACVAALAGILLGAFIWTPPLYQITYRPIATEPFSMQELLQVDLNHADAQGLESLPGIGSKKAQLILDYRQIHGPFKSVQDVLQVKGVTQQMLDEWGDRVCIK